MQYSQNVSHLPECLLLSLKKQNKTKAPQTNSKNPTPKQTKTIYQNKTKFGMEESFFPHLYLMLILSFNLQREKLLGKNCF